MRAEETGTAVERCLRCGAPMEWRHQSWQCDHCRFKLGGDMSQWVLNGGGTATCTAELYYILNANGTAEWNGKGAQGGNVSLAHTAFDAGS